MSCFKFIYWLLLTATNPQKQIIKHTDNQKNLNEDHNNVMQYDKNDDSFISSSEVTPEAQKLVDERLKNDLFRINNCNCYKFIFAKNKITTNLLYNRFIRSDFCVI